MLEGNAQENVINVNDESDRISWPVKTRNFQKRKNNLKYERNEKRKNVVIQEKSAVETSSEGCNNLFI